MTAGEQPEGIYMYKSASGLYCIILKVSINENKLKIDYNFFFFFFFAILIVYIILLVSSQSDQFSI